MKHFYSRVSSVIVSAILFFTCFSSKAQTPMYYKTGVGTSGNTIPLNQTSQKTQLLYQVGDFNATPANGPITKLYFRNSLAAATSTYTNFQVSFLQNNDAAFPSTSYYTGLTVSMIQASITVNGNATAGGWFEIPLTAPYFIYDNTKTLIVEIQYTARTGALSTTTSTSVGNKRCSGTSLTATTGTTNTTQNDFGIDIGVAAPCTSPPVAGTATSNAPGAVCAGTNVTLNVAGATSGGGQSYQWQSSPTIGGSYTNVGLPSTVTSSLTIAASATLYYQCAVTCSGNTQYSVPVLVSVNPGISGVFTIDASSPASSTNFQSFTAAVATLVCGVTGPVTFNVAAGGAPYNEQITIPALPGSSAVNTVTFNGNGNTITFGGQVTGARHTIKLTGADYVTFNNLTIKGTNTTYGWGVHLMTASDNVTLNNCTIDLTANTSTTATSTACVVASNSTSAVTTDGNNANYLTINGCTLKGAYQSIILYGNNLAPYSVGNVITNNTIQDFYATAIELNSNDGTTISNNDIKRDARTGVTTFTGVELNSGTKNTTISGNKIHDTHNAATSLTGTAYGIYITGCDATAGSENKVYNNLIYNFNSASGTIYALYNSSSDGVFYYHNTISLDYASATAGTTRGFYQTTLATNIQFKNNIISVARGGTGAKNCLYFATTTSTIACDNNILYVDPAEGIPGVGVFGTTNYFTIFDWKTANGNAYDQQSFGVDPAYVNLAANNFIPTAVFADNIGANVGITTDITGATRMAPPDPGAYEFSAVACSGSPTAGTAAANTNIICSGTSFSLTLSGNSLGSGQTFQWQSSPDNVVWTDIIGANTYPYFLTQTVSTYYRVKTICGASLPEFSTEVFVSTPTASLNGTYTVNATQPASATNFQKLSDAAKTCNCGITGPVTLNVAPASGPYNDQVMFSSTSNSSAANPIVLNGNGNTINFAPIPSARHIIKLDGVDYMTLNNLNVTGLDLVFGWGIQLTNAANNNTINGCTVDVSAVTSTVAANSGGIVATGNNATIASAGNNANNLMITGCTVIGGYTGISLYGNTGALDAVGNTVTQTTVRDFYGDGIVINNTDGAVISNNDVSRANRILTTTFAGIELSGGTKSSLVNANKVHDTHNTASSQTGTAYGIYSTSNDASAGAENKIQNNIIYNFNSGSGAQYGIYNSGSNFANYYHNTIVLNNASSTAGTTKGFYQSTAATDIQFKNNLIFITRGGSGAKNCVDFGTNTSTIVSNNNLLFISSPAGTTFYGSFGSIDYATLATWQTANANAYDQQSGSNYPDFVNMAAYDFTPMEISIDNIGAAGLGVATDFNGMLRSGTPDVGALEFMGTVLPITLLGISASYQNTDVIVSWSVAMDDNISTYDVERSAEGSTFEKIGNVSATGASNYRFTDLDPAAKALYYRLKMNEKNGKSGYSPVVKVNIDNSSNSNVAVYPNPFTGKMSVQVVTTTDGQARIKLQNLFGVTVKNETRELKAGANVIELNDLDALAPGVYNVYVEVNRNKYVQKLVK